MLDFGLFYTMTVVFDNEAVVVPKGGGGHLSKKLLVKDKFLSKITFTTSTTSRQQADQEILNSEKEILSVKNSEIIMNSKVSFSVARSIF